MAERSLKITKVAHDTGISRNTITSTAQNDGKMIQLETINTLCKYLEIDPGDFFSYVPYDADFEVYPEVKYTPIKDDIYKFITYPFECYLSVVSKNNKETFDITVVIDSPLYFGKHMDEFIYNAEPLNNENAIYYNILLGNADNDKNYKKEKDSFKKFWSDLPAGFKTDIQDMIKEKVREGFLKKSNLIFESLHVNETIENYIDTCGEDFKFSFNDASSFKTTNYDDTNIPELIKKENTFITDDDLPF